MTKPNCKELRNKAPTWTIDASTLQIFWGEVFPRLVGWAWALNYSPMVSGDVTALLPTILKAYRDWLAPPLSVERFEATRFGGRLKKVIVHFEQESGVMPVRYHGPGAFDFIISDFGLDLFAPPRPVSRTELLRFYEYRATGQGTIGLPTYLDEADALAFDVQSPTGPSQVWTDQGGLDMVINAAGCKLGELQCLDDPGQPYPYYQGSKGSDTIPVPDPTDRLGDMIIVGTVAGDTIRFPLPLDPTLATQAQALFRPFQPVRNYTVQGYFAAVSRLRCWQLEGSVYRGIVQQLPRVVATVWRETLMNCVGEGSYAQRFYDPKLMRDIFAERLESRLPDYNDMVFEVADGPGGRPMEDIEISNQGLRFPRPEGAPTEAVMFRAIANGRAGNPVFTDSKRPEREG